MLKIDNKIVGYSVASSDDSSEPESGEDPAPHVVRMGERIARPMSLTGRTYKIKPPEHVSGHALYVTISDIVLNEGTEHETRQPYEIFINCKALEHYQWIVALTLIMSAVFRKGGDITFLVDELESVFDPRGGYWNKGKFVSSIIAEIGSVIKEHLIGIGLLEEPELDEHQLALIAEKKAAMGIDSVIDDSESAGGDFPPNATVCTKCATRSVVMLDGCSTCFTVFRFALFVVMSSYEAYYPSISG